MLAANTDAHDEHTALSSEHITADHHTGLKAIWLIYIIHIVNMQFIDFAFIIRYLLCYNSNGHGVGKFRRAIVRVYDGQ